MTDRTVKKDAEDAYVGRWVFPRSDDPLEMVGRKGVHDLIWLSEYIATLLQLGKSDRLLDLCCGNGLLSVLIAPQVREILGVDFSEALLQRAKHIAAAPNIDYRQADARAIVRVANNRKFEKVLISAAFQYFDRSTARELLSALWKSSSRMASSPS